MIISYGYFRLAARAAIESICYPKVGAVISNKRPLSFGYNKPKSHPVYSNPDETLRTTIHAEMDAVRFLTTDDLNGAIVWVYRETYGTMPALARPCNECIARLYEYGVKTMIYTIDEPPYYMIERIR